MKIIYKTHATASGRCSGRAPQPEAALMPPSMQVEPTIGMALYSIRAILHRRGGDVSSS
jgi:hypothetical protein